MNKITIKSFLALASMTVLLAMCTKTDENDGVNYFVSIDLKNTALTTQADRAATQLVYSIDNGVTWGDAQNIKIGQSYQVMVKANGCSTCAFAAPGKFLIADTGYDLDWSASNPKPDNSTADAPKFVLNGTSSVSVKVTYSGYCPLHIGDWVGNWTGHEGAVTGAGTFNGSNDAMVFTQDATDPNKIWATNMFGDGAAQIWYMVFNVSTSKDTQTVHVPAQSTPEGCDLLESTGTYDQCNGTLSIPINYCDYIWTYTFTR